MDALAVRRNLWTSDLPSTEKSALSRVLSRIPGYATRVYEGARPHVAATGEVIHTAVESGIVGGVIGAAEGYFGDQIGVPFLYAKAADGKDMVDSAGNKVPSIAIRTPALVAVAGYAGALFFPQESFAPTMLRAAGIATGIWTAALARDWVRGMETNPPAAASADLTHVYGEGYDRIAELARQIP